jgi:hypothetical protein
MVKRQRPPKASSKEPFIKPAAKKIPLGLARVRKELPPPGRIIESKKTRQRKRAKEKLREELKAALTDRNL